MLAFELLEEGVTGTPSSIQQLSHHADFSIALSGGVQRTTIL